MAISKIIFVDFFISLSFFSVQYEFQILKNKKTHYVQLVKLVIKVLNRQIINLLFSFIDKKKVQ